ncbi:MAG: OmpA family protein [Leptospiraceae bacterium]|nr:OmpA family protein [Leptospiraceae bacterium]
MTELNPIYLAQKAFIVLALLLAACLSPQKDPGPPVQQRTVVHEELKAPAGERMARVEELRQSLNDIRYAPEDLGFEYKETEVNPEYLKKWWWENGKIIEDAVRKLPPGYAIEITGHTDSTGPRQPTGNKPGNLAISENRATSVYRSLQSLGIPEDSMVVRGIANDEPIAGLKPTDQRHRRVTFSVVENPNIEDPALKRALEADFIDRLKAGAAKQDELADPGDPQMRRTVAEVLNRNRQWKDMVVVVDVTGSMMPFLGQVVEWMRLNEQQRKVRRYVFFNDGDNRPEEEKAIGNTGGIYIVPDWASLDEALDVARQAIANGYGGTRPESDIEALIKGISGCPECGDVILVADNGAPVRDISLASRVDRPVRIILCDARDRINPEYLELARLSKGSVHTIERDIANLHRMKEGESFEYEDNIYVIRNGSFIETSLAKEKKEILSHIIAIDEELERLDSRSEALLEQRAAYEKKLKEIESLMQENAKSGGTEKEP